MAKFDFLREMDTGSSPPPRGRRMARWATIVLGAGLVVSIFYNSSTEYLAPFDSAVKVSRYSGGIDPDPYYGPGLFLTPPGVTFYRYPLVVQSLTMAASSAEATAEDDNTRTIGALEVDSSDGSKIRIDATLLYRIIDPMKIHQRIGPGRMFEDNAIIPRASQALKESLGKLKAEDFYNERLRIQATQEAQQSLNRALADMGLSVDHVLIRQYYYLPEYQQQIEERKVQDQMVFTNTSMGESAKIEVQRKKLEAEGQAAVEVERQKGTSEVATIRAEADLYTRKRRSEGDLLVSLAQAQGTELENSAYKASAGSDNLVGLEMADVLKGVDVIFLESGKDGTNLLDLGQTLRMFDVEGR